MTSEEELPQRGAEREIEIASALLAVQERIERSAMKSGREGSAITLIAVTKTYPIGDVQILRRLGVDNFGENRDSEGRTKAYDVPAIWHFQGQIQSNKIASIAKWADVVHSIDESRHVTRFSNLVPEGKTLRIFLQVCLDPQPGRGGVAPEELGPLAELVLASSGLRLEGLMAVAPLGENPKSAFERLAEIHSVFQANFPNSPYLSAGMSGDFEVAIEHGATHVRIGSSILGTRSVNG